MLQHRAVWVRRNVSSRLRIAAVFVAEDGSGQQRRVYRAGLPMASVPTGMPAGIWAMESRESMTCQGLGFHRHAEYRQAGLGGRHARQVSGAAGTGDDDFDAAASAAAVRYLNSRSGVRWAETTRVS